MNKAYRLVWNRRLNAWVVASELARSGGKKSGARVRTGLASVAVVLGFAPHLAAAELSPDALPTGGSVDVGKASIATSGARMDVTQSSQKVIINWHGFDIGSDAQVNFVQPGASAVALNRVSGATASRIEGQLSANGKVLWSIPTACCSAPVRGSMPMPSWHRRSTCATATSSTANTGSAAMAAASRTGARSPRRREATSPSSPRRW
ncbi:filamentous hemagglutinin N-terminal domain-containing protein [Pseudoxanthomonas sp. NC8]|nr:filamentous hemagglutinin N-terminal domain-containing protein [Pseudoxanthomonas sp. NC8]